MKQSSWADPVRVTVLSACCAVVLVAIAPDAGAHKKAAPSKVPVEDSFSGQIAGGTGKFLGAVGKVRIYLHPRPGETNRHLTLVLDGRRCHKAKHCLRLSGKLKGTLTQQPTIPDTGESLAVKTGGIAKPLGHVSAKGNVHGTGFIFEGQERLQLTLKSARGTVSISAQSGEVPGFTSP